ncbi:DUF6074 family protein [Bradyrhizobium barranii subsp. apii]|uniref:DUF6074 family protein n=1 Tax=Bradyrhizobium barranii subsp. apii TaxID=2819348 RepID=A0A8T5VV57_9BRAD|nr:DUF6074 family protein [Bradyrhizobium barranii]UPT88630.1 DUF6074 family protein [Bradyrhizobium barranii subsp. apii]
MSDVVPFPLSRRWVFIERQARRASELNEDAGERHILYQLEVQRAAMRRKGIDEALIAREIRCMESAIRVSLQRLLMGGAA